MDDSDDIDPTLKKLMEDNFGPPADAGATQEEDRIAKGLETVQELSDPAATSPIKWLHEGGESLAPPLEEPRKCFTCSKPNPSSSCAKCGVASYCSRECQVSDWGKKGEFGGHKACCAAYKVLGRDQKVAAEPAARRAVIEAFLARVRLYLCPFVLCKSGAASSVGGKKKGAKKPAVASRGFAFVQCGCSLAQLALPAPRDCAGYRLPPGERGCLLHYVTLAEFEADIVGSDPSFELAREPLASAVAQHDERQEIAVLVRTACGLVFVALHPLVPEWRVAVTMAAEYEAQDALQLDLDDIS